MKKAFPLVSIVIPTYNSAKTLKMCLDSLVKQSYPRSRIEIGIVDGGSKDDTTKIAQRYRCVILKNPKTDILEAEKIGFFWAKGKYLVGLAPDEVLENSKSLEKKINVFVANRNVKAVLLTGYKTPSKYHSINNYINEFGDPFSYFIYRDSKGEKFHIKDLDRKYEKVKDDDNYNIYNFYHRYPIPLLELWAGGCMIDLKYVKKKFPNIRKNPSFIPLISYLLIGERKLIGATKNDNTLHYSSANITKYLKKIRSRIEFNVYKTPMGKGGFSGREVFEKSFFRYKKYLFIPYTFTFIFPLLDTFYLVLTRRKYIYLLHTLLCIYTAILIIFYSLLKTFGINHRIKLYGS